MQSNIKMLVMILCSLNIKSQNSIFQSLCSIMTLKHAIIWSNFTMPSDWSRKNSTDTAPGGGLPDKIYGDDIVRKNDFQP